MRRWCAAGLTIGWALVLGPFELLATLANAGLGAGLAVAALGLAFTASRKDRVGGVVFGVLCALYLGVVGTRGLTRARPAAPEGEPLTVVSYNILFRGGAPDRTLATIRAQDADLVLLQEVTPDWVPEVVQLGPHHTAAPHPGSHGLAVVSRFPLSRRRHWTNRDGSNIAQCVDVDLPSGRVGVCHVHLASPSAALTQSEDPLDMLGALERNAARRRRQWTELEAEMRESHDPILIAGDFNTLPSERMLVDARRRWVDATRHVAALRAASTWPQLAASAHRPPWPLDRLAGSGPWFRIDYVLVDPALGVVSAGRVPGGGSDHHAVRATLTVPR